MYAAYVCHPALSIRMPTTRVNLVTSRQRPTGADVARLAGVTQSSVSRVFAGKGDGRVSAELQERIREAALQLGYQPQATGRMLRSGKAHALGLVVTDFENPYFGPVSRGAQREARTRHESIVLMEDAFDDDGAFLPYRELDAGLVDGLLLFSIAPPAPTAARRPQITLVESEHRGFNSVVFDGSAGLRSAVRHLVDLGHRHHAYLGASIDRWAFERRLHHWRSASHEVAPDLERTELAAPLDLDAAARAAFGVLKGSARPTAIICGDDLLAAGVYRAAAEQGLSIPHDLSVVSFGGTVVGEALWPRVTRITAPGALLGAAAVSAHLAMFSEPPSRTRLPVELNIRDSTARPAVTR